MKADISEILHLLLQDIDKLKSMNVDIHNGLVNGLDSISPTGEKTISISWTYTDPEEHAKFVQWLQDGRST